MQDLKVTYIQTELFWDDKEANRSRFSQLFREIQDDTDLVVLPETFTTGFNMNPRKTAESFAEQTTLNWMQGESRQYGWALCGSIIAEEEGKYYNRFLFVEPDGKYYVYNKRHLFRMADENKEFSAGTERIIIKYRGWSIAPFICYDLRFPVWSRNTEQYDCALYVANWPAARRHPWKILLRARAIENQCYVVGVNRIGKDGNGIEYAGDSAIIDPKGLDLVASEAAEEAIETFHLNAAELIEFREKFPVAMDADSFRII